MPRNRLIDSKEAQFRPDDGGTPIDLHTYMQSVRDTLRQRIAIHEYLKVDGGEVELMGRSPNRYQFTINYVGSRTDSLPGWRKQYAALAARLDKSPKGILIHPVFGQIRVCVESIDGASIDVSRATDHVAIPISFVADGINSNYSPETATSTESWLTVATDQIAEVSAVAAPYTSAATQVANFASSVATYADAARAASNTSTPDPALATQLETVTTNANAAIDAIEADPAVERNADAFDAVSSIELVADACTQSYEALALSKPVLVTYTVKADTNLLALASLLYGNDAGERVEEILTLNRIADPYRILSGTVLQVSQPTV